MWYRSKSRNEYVNRPAIGTLRVLSNSRSDIAVIEGVRMDRQLRRQLDSSEEFRVPLDADESFAGCPIRFVAVTLVDIG